jgi:hypothetical protein
VNLTGRSQALIATSYPVSAGTSPSSHVRGVRRVLPTAIDATYSWRTASGSGQTARAVLALIKLASVKRWMSFDREAERGGQTWITLRLGIEQKISIGLNS